MATAKNVNERFDALWMPEPNTGCFLWTAALSHNGYGWFRIAGRQVRAHRFAYERAHGPIDDAYLVRHKCDTPPCVNPDHLIVGTHADNMRDMRLRGRSLAGDRNPARLHREAVSAGVRRRFATRPETKPLGSRNGRAKLTADDVRSIREEHAAGGVSYAALARRHRVSLGLIRHIVVRMIWRHI